MTDSNVKPNTYCTEAHLKSILFNDSNGMMVFQYFSIRPEIIFIRFNAGALNSFGMLRMLGVKNVSIRHFVNELHMYAFNFNS